MTFKNYPICSSLILIVMISGFIYQYKNYLFLTESKDRISYLNSIYRNHLKSIDIVSDKKTVTVTMKEIYSLGKIVKGLKTFKPTKKIKLSNNRKIILILHFKLEDDKSFIIYDGAFMEIKPNKEYLYSNEFSKILKKHLIF